MGDNAPLQNLAGKIKGKGLCLLIPAMFNEGGEIVGQHIACVGGNATGKICQSDHFHAADIKHFIILQAFDISPDSTAVSTMMLPGFICCTIAEVTITGALRPNT